MASSILQQACSGKWAVVTGASAGIGEAIAVELAAAGVHLVLTARRRERLEALAERLRAQYSIQTQVVVADLALPEGPQQIYEATVGAGLLVDILIDNAGFGEYGEFLAAGWSVGQRLGCSARLGSVEISSDGQTTLLKSLHPSTQVERLLQTLPFQVLLNLT